MGSGSGWDRVGVPTPGSGWSGSGPRFGDPVLSRVQIPNIGDLGNKRGPHPEGPGPCLGPCLGPCPGPCFNGVRWDLGFRDGVGMGSGWGRDGVGTPGSGFLTTLQNRFFLLFLTKVTKAPKNTSNIIGGGQYRSGRGPFWGTPLLPAPTSHFSFDQV